MAVDSNDVHVLIPDGSGWLSVCVLDQLLSEIIDGRDLDEAADNSAIDSIEPDNAQAIAKVRKLNNDGDAAAYWGLT